MIADIDDIDNQVYGLDNQVVEWRTSMPFPQTVTLAATRRTETPNAAMTTLASPTLGSTQALSLWRVEMADSATGPEHAFDSEQVWTVLDGSLEVQADDHEQQVATGDTVVFPAGVTRQIRAVGPVTAIVAGYGAARVQVAGEAEDRGTPAWIA